jgi:hypothetical protein
MMIDIVIFSHLFSILIFSIQCHVISIFPSSPMKVILSPIAYQNRLNLPLRRSKGIVGLSSLCEPHKSIKEWFIKYIIASSECFKANTFKPPPQSHDGVMISLERNGWLVINY